ncbi:C40 family peptidase [Nesterenkonia sp. F]|uniref:C40 family peptidase n=1 Tax=Nesterenkonia sp. F TaxID=795955 RepID=UPI000255D0CE|nr:C40 family peptidase [Nesterenkonia sp. F]
MTDTTTYSSRRERRRQAEPRLARAVVQNAGSAGRSAAVVAAASGLVLSTGAAAAADQGSEERAVSTLEVAQSGLSVERASKNEATAVTASDDVELTFDRPEVSSTPAPEGPTETELEAQRQAEQEAEEEAQRQAEAERQAEQEAAQQEQAAAEESSQESSASLSDYRSGTRGLVEELAQQEGVSATAMFDQLIGDSAYSSGGVLDHAALQARVDELTGADEQPAEQESQEPQTTVASVEDEEPEQSEAPEEPEQTQSSSAGSLSGVVSAAYSGLGTPYVYGGKGPGGWDCSGFVAWAYAQAGYSIPSSTSAIQGAGNLRWTDNPQPGDLVIQNGGGHVGIYVGNGQFIGAQNPSTGTLQYSYESRPGNSHVGYMTLR